MRPDGKTQVAIEYKAKADGSVEPIKLHTVVISTQHAEPLRATCIKAAILRGDHDGEIQNLS